MQLGLYRFCFTVTKATGPLAGAIPPDAEVSPELVQALTSSQLNPEDIEIVTDSTGKTVIRLKTEVSNAIEHSF